MGGVVRSKKMKGKGKCFRLTAVIDHTPEDVFDILVPGIVDWPKWNPTILECRHIADVNDNTKISYSLSAPQAGGLVASRDFVNIVHWKKRNDVMMSASCHVTHPDVPVYKGIVRGENNPACYCFAPVPGRPDQCEFTTILNSDLKGWIPQFLIDQAMSGFLHEYLGYLTSTLDERKNTESDGEKSSPSHEAKG